VNITSSSNISLPSPIQIQEQTIKALEEAIKQLVQTNTNQARTIIDLQSSNNGKDETIKSQGQTILDLQSVNREQDETIKSQGQTILALQSVNREQGETIKFQAQTILGLQSVNREQDETIKSQGQTILDLQSSNNGKDETIKEQRETILHLQSSNKAKDKTIKKQARTILRLQLANKKKNATIKCQKQTLATFQSQITELKGRLGQHSGNSSFPSSRDIGAPPKPAKTRSKRRPVGGQKGRKGVTRSLSDTPDKTVTLAAERCSCGCSLLETEVENVERRQIITIVFSPLETTEYRVERKKCPKCSRIVSAPFPDGVENTINFGVNLKVLILYLRIVLFTPYKKIEQLLNDFYGLKISPATLEKMISTASKALDSYDEEVRRYLLASPILHADETGCRVGGKRWWLHCLSTKYLTYYWIHQSRGAKAMDAMGILPYFTGILVHDFWAPYAKYKCYHAYCNAHLIRELQGIYDVFKQEWAKELKAHLKKMYKYTFRRESEDNSENQNSKMWDLKFWELIEEYERLVRQGKLVNPPPVKEEGEKGRTKNTKGWNLASRMEEHIYEVLAFFITGGQIPFTNNLVEQAIRMMKVQQKISGTFRTKQGAIHFARLRGYISTMRKQDHSVLEAVKALAGGKPILLSDLEANRMGGGCC